MAALATMASVAVIGHEAEKSAQPLHVARSGLMVDDAGGHEQRGLERGVVHHVEDGGDGAQRAAEAQQQRDQAEMADGRVGEQTLYVPLEDREIGAQNERHHAGEADDPEPFVGAREHRPEPRHQEHAGLHHGRRMQIGRDRRRRGHGVGQPEMERKLRALGERPEEHKNQDGHIEIVRADKVAGAQDTIEIVAPDNMADQQDARQQAEAADAGNRQRHAGAVAGTGVVVPIADQQEGKDAGQFPEYDQQDQVSGNDDPEHRSHESEEERKEPGNRIFRRHVVARINDDEEADAAYQHGEQPGKSVHSQSEIETKRRQPFDIAAHARLDRVTEG